MYKIRKPTRNWGEKISEASNQSFKLTFVLFPISKPSTKPVPFASNFSTLTETIRGRMNCRY